MSDLQVTFRTLSRRDRKRLANRQAISDAATRLFAERGFDEVTIDEIADAADVGRMTVFNHFPRKEDMFFDLDQEWRADLLGALFGREANVSPIEAFRLFAHDAVDQGKPYVVFSPASQRFYDAMSASETLQGRWRSIRDEIAHLLAETMAKTTGNDVPNADTHLTAHLMAAIWSAAASQSQAMFRQTQDAQAAKTLFLNLIDKGAAGLKIAMAGTTAA